jgi:hypothetical protein
MLRNLLVATVLTIVVAGGVSAAPMLLMEFTHQVVAVESTEALSGPFPFRLEAYEDGFGADPGYVYFRWDDEYKASDVGMTFFAPPEVVAGASQAFASPRADYSLETGPGNLLHLEASDSFCQPNQCIMKHVPDLTTYWVTSVRRIIDQIEIEPLGEVFRGGQRIQFWGEPIPPVPGDFNHNGSVDGADYVLWRNRNGTDGGLPNESGLTPLDVTQEDYDFWRANFGRSASAESMSLAPNAIPEPSSSGLVLLGAVVCFIRTKG